MTENTNIPDLWTDSDSYADQYQNNAQVREACALLELPSAGSLVDVGCGNGVFSIAVARQFPECSVLACDSLSSAIVETRRRASLAGRDNLRAEVASANELPLSESSVDRVLIRNVLHHLSSIDQTLTEISRVLAPSGLLLLETPCNPGDAAFGDLISDVHMLMDGSHRRTYHAPGAIAACLGRHGIAASDPVCWPYSFPVETDQVDLIKSRGAAERLSLDESADDGASIQLTLTRIIGRKT